MIEKNGAITDETPEEITPVKGTPGGRFYGSPSGCAKPNCCRTKAANDANSSRTDHAATRAADAVANAARK